MTTRSSSTGWISGSGVVRLGVVHTESLIDRESQQLGDGSRHDVIRGRSTTRLSITVVLHDLVGLECAGVFQSRGVKLDINAAMWSFDDGATMVGFAPMEQGSLTVARPDSIVTVLCLSDARTRVVEFKGR